MCCKTSSAFSLTAAAPEVFRRKDNIGRFLGLLSELSEAPSHQVGPGEEAAGDNWTSRENRTQ